VQAVPLDGSSACAGLLLPHGDTRRNEHPGDGQDS
jgi:hypothetical protein